MHTELVCTVACVTLVFAGCTRTRELASSRRDAATHDDAAVLDGGDLDAGAASPEAGVFTLDAGIAFCGPRPCACSNGRDDDGDGKADGFDPECTGAFDDFEQDFATGVADEARTAKCQDCFFDVVPGRDACNRATSCTLSGTSSGGTGACRSCAVSEACTDHCARLAPNGCDCFGCCEVFRAGAPVTILLQAGCSMQTLDDPARCTPCVLAPDCRNGCDDCELCPGRTIADLPASCGGSFACLDTEPCATSSDCSGPAYCQAGCCLDIVI
jgi:hypothetical protein